MRKSFLLAAVPLAVIPLMIVACSGSSSDLAGDDTAPPGTDDGGGGSDSTVGSQDSATNTDSGTTPPIDAGVDTGIPSCTGLTYCDDFESYLDAGEEGGVQNGKMLGPWKISIGGKADMKVDTVKPFSGLRSLHITTPANDTTESNGTLHRAATGALVTGNDMFGRAMVYYSTAGGNGLPQGHSWVFQSQGTSVKEAANVSMNAANSGGTYFLNYHSATSPEQSVQSTVKPVGGKWLCMQWEYNGSGTTPADEGKIWIDGVVVVDSKNQTPNWDFATPWSNFDFGFTHYQTITNSMDIYLDDFALDNKMVPCPPPAP